MGNENIRKLKNKANTLPLLPGVYIMSDKDGNVIYVGKAKRLKNRVTQYFGSETNHSLKVRKMVENVFDFKVIICDSEFEALTLENSLIKQYTPKYNILLKDDKGYHYIRITDDKWRRILSTKNNIESGQYIGPYNSGFIVNQTVEQVQKIYKLPNCNRNFDKPSKPCLNYHIGICMAPCIKNVSIDEYNEAFDSAISFIKNSSVEKESQALNEKMDKASEQLKFEYAAKIRDRIKAIEKISQKQKVIIHSTDRIDAFAVSASGENICITVFVFKEGHLTDQEQFIFDDFGDKNEFYSSFIPQYYTTRRDIPKEILIDMELFDQELLGDWLSKIKGSRVTIHTPKIKEKKLIVDMCASNASQHLAQHIDRNIKETTALNELAKLLGLLKPPTYIESYDISHTGGDNNVGAMVVFKDGRPYKQAYRKFKIKGFIGQDDFRSMAEVVSRRFDEYKKGTDEAFSILPDLILLDGGKGQLSAVKAVLEQKGIDVFVFGMVKDGKHRTNAITDTGGSILIKGNRPAYTLVTAIQNEVHRFAITYHRNVRNKNMLASELLKIEGVGKKRADDLLKKFKTLKKIKSANVEELMTVQNISEKTAKKIIEYYKNR